MDETRKYSALISVFLVLTLPLPVFARCMPCMGDCFDVCLPGFAFKSFLLSVMKMFQEDFVFWREAHYHILTVFLFFCLFYFICKILLKKAFNT